MKILLTLATLLAAATVSAAPAEPAFTKIEFFGLNCTVCEDGIKEKFEQLPAVSSVTMDMNNFLICVRNKPGLTLSAAEIRTTLAIGGFNPVKVEQTAQC